MLECPIHTTDYAVPRRLLQDKKEIGERMIFRFRFRLRRYPLTLSLHLPVEKRSRPC